MATVPPPVHHLEIAPKCKEASYICNSAAGFNRCISKLQDEIQRNVRILIQELNKGKSVDHKACHVLTEDTSYIFYPECSHFLRRKWVIFLIFSNEATIHCPGYPATKSSSLLLEFTTKCIEAVCIHLTHRQINPVGYRSLRDLCSNSTLFQHYL